MKRSILIRPQNQRGVVKLESRLAKASRMAKQESAKHLGGANGHKVVSVSIDAFKDNGFTTRSHRSILEAKGHFQVEHPQLAAAIFKF